MTVINAEGLVLGRLASQVAKKLLKGEEVFIVNAEKSLVTGSKVALLKEYMHKRERRGFRKGPYFPRRPDLIMKRTVRGMLPYQKPNGRKAFKNLRVYIDVPKELEGQKFETIESASTVGTASFVKLGDISKALGSKFWV